jgi:hypothetical protein
MSKINVADYGVDTSEFIASNKVKPYLQWFNPQSENYGFALDPKFVEMIEFKPDENWNLEEVELQDEQKQSFTGKMWFSRHPRMILLNGYPDALISNEIKEKSDPMLMRLTTKGNREAIYDKNLSKEDRSDPYFTLVVLLVDKDNNLLSKSPLLFKTTGKAKSIFKDKYKEFIDDSLKQFSSLTGVALPKRIPTCKFTSKFIFSAELGKGTVTGKAGLSSKCTVVSSYETINQDNFTNLVLANDHPTLTHALSLLPELKSYVYPSVDANTGEVNLTAEDMAELREIGVEF